MRVSILFTAILLFSLAACQKDGSPLADTEGKEVGLRKAPRPFKGTLYNQAVEEVGTECDCGTYLPFSGAGRGNITHMGKVTSEIMACVIDIEEGQVAGACVNLTAANGDELTLAMGPHTFLPVPNCECLAAEATMEITGGTGRFEGAYGTVNLSTVFDPATLSYTEEYDGEIYY